MAGATSRTSSLREIWTSAPASLDSTESLSWLTNRSSSLEVRHHRSLTGSPHRRPRGTCPLLQRRDANEPDRRRPRRRGRGRIRDQFGGLSRRSGWRPSRSSRQLDATRWRVTGRRNTASSRRVRRVAQPARPIRTSTDRACIGPDSVSPGAGYEPRHWASEVTAVAAANESRRSSRSIRPRAKAEACSSIARTRRASCG